MRLQLHIFRITDVQFGDNTRILNGVLYINRQELKQLLEKDGRLEKVDVELAHPSESCRILQVCDVIEPRAKRYGEGEDFPGVLGKQGIAGEGDTLVLRGSAIVITSQKIHENEGERGKIIEMSGPAAAFCPYSTLHNIILLAKPAKEVASMEYEYALKVAGLKASVFLGRAGRNLEPDAVETYDLAPSPEVSKNMEELPRVAYIFQVHSQQHPTAINEPILYGDNVRGLLPTVVHPNEVLDGGILRAYRGIDVDTYSFQNHPIIRELYRKHGKTLCFAGVIVTIAPFTMPEKDRGAAMAAKLARYILGADGAILTKIGGGAPHIDMAQTAEKCEELGVKTVVMAQVLTSTNADDALIFNSPRLDAIINTGSDERISLPAVERIIGSSEVLPDGRPARGELTVQLMDICSSRSQIGASRLRAYPY